MGKNYQATINVTVKEPTYRNSSQVTRFSVFLANVRNTCRGFQQESGLFDCLLCCTIDSNGFQPSHALRDLSKFFQPQNKNSGCEF